MVQEEEDPEPLVSEVGLSRLAVGGEGLQGLAFDLRACVHQREMARFFLESWGSIANYSFIRRLWV